MAPEELTTMDAAGVGAAQSKSQRAYRFIKGRIANQDGAWVYLANDG